MSYYNQKCIGCGEYLSNDPLSPSFVKDFDKNKKYCYRCFQMKNYGKNPVIVNDDYIIKTLQSLEIKNNPILLVVDLFDINGSLIDEYKDYDNLYLAINKLGFLPKKFNHELTFKKIAKIIEKQGFNKYKNIFFYDAKSHLGIKNIYDSLFKNKKNLKVYFLGKTNVGKSSLINSLLKSQKIESKVIASPFVNTTLNLNKIKIGKNWIIDTPGFRMSNYMSLFDHDILKNIYESKPIIKAFSLKGKNANQTFIIGNFFAIDILENDEISSVTIYTYGYVSINRMKTINKEKNFNLENYHPKVRQETEFCEKNYLIQKQKVMVVIPGICIIVLKNVKKINLTYIKKIGAYFFDESII